MKEVFEVPKSNSDLVFSTIAVVKVVDCQPCIGCIGGFLVLTETKGKRKCEYCCPQKSHVAKVKLNLLGDSKTTFI
jgi:hypothetical protein